jgi:hypothetical protein
LISIKSSEGAVDGPVSIPLSATDRGKDGGRRPALAPGGTHVLDVPKGRLGRIAS